MWKRSLFVLLAVFVLSVSGAEASHAADQIKLTPGHIAGEWRNANNLILALAGAIAMGNAGGNAGGNEWPQKLRNMKPKGAIASDNQAIAQAIAKFAVKLNVILKSENLKPLKPFPVTKNVSIPVLYTRSGQILDGLAEYLIKSDSLATVGIYYQDQDLTGKSNADVATAINIASQRLASFITKSGITKSGS